MNLAILIGVSSYKNVQNLPGCKNDVVFFNELIKHTKKYDNILFINNNTDSTFIKNELVNFISQNKFSQINEVLFYFTGHGLYSENEFYYILSDFEQDKKQQTSLQNSELDSLLKSLNPKLVTKIVDACESGYNYIKDINKVDTYIKSTQSQFNNCYFLFSSLNIQSSYQDQEFSFFTLSFFNAIKKYSDNNIRYKDIIDYISDEFTKISEQTPFFVIQADFTENFCKKNDELNAFLETIPNTLNNIKDSSENDSLPTKSLEDLIKEDAGKHLNQEEIIYFFEDVKSCVEKFKPKEEFQNLYEYKHKFLSNLNYDLNLTQIGQYVSQYKEFYAEPTYEDTSYETVETPNRLDMFGRFNKPYTVTRTKKELSGYNLTTTYPYEQITIDIKSNYPNLNSFLCSIFFITTDRKIRVYWCLTKYIKKGWDNTEIEKRFKWNIFEDEFINKNDLINNFGLINNEINILIGTEINRVLK
ncbi:caspase family protein [Chryseobacterium sp. YIM B08800]|uniref:caspase family protein n=1 Tax=Chryseobacterium sp. YIM B08800 TaxID=2984136 RepID=UPI00223FAF28|nr:caspase family protein [Chryseobacterium sp. YIM B08800]